MDICKCDTLNLNDIIPSIIDFIKKEKGNR